LKAFCISHEKDVDGIGSAALVVAATGASFLLSDYDSLEADLDRVPADTQEFYLCDLGANETNIDEFARKLGRLAKKGKVTYIDHHFMAPQGEKKVRDAGVTYVHDVEECASMLTYKTLKERLPERARMIALLGAVTDYMDDSPMASRLMEQADRQFILLEATMLAYAVALKGDEKGFPEMLVKELSMMKHPHEIEGIPRDAVRQLQVSVKLGEEVKANGKKLGRLAYMVTSQQSTGNVSKLLIGAFEVPVGVSLKQKTKDWYEVSLRSTSESKVHLGKTIGRIASGLGGNGGGHAKAAGGRIPAGKVQEMLEALAKEV
jgi:RecJ-like exonuclease